MTKILSYQNIKKIGYLIVILAIGLIIREIYYYFNSISLNYFNESEEGLTGDFFRYKQDSLHQGYLSFLLLLFGIGLIKRNIFGWLIPQTFLLIVNIPFLIFIPYEEFDEIKYLLLFGVTYTVFFIFTLWLFKKDKLMHFFQIESIKLKYYYSIIIILSSIYWIFNIYGNYIIK